MHKPSRGSVYSIIGLASFGVVYDCGLFGPTDRHDHSAVISIIAPSTSTVTMSAGVLYISQSVTGEDIAVPLPVPPKPAQV